MYKTFPIPFSSMSSASPDSVPASAEYSRNDEVEVLPVTTKGVPLVPSFVAQLTQPPAFEEIIEISQMPPHMFEDQTNGGMHPRTNDTTCTNPPPRDFSVYAVKNISVRASQKSLNEHLSQSSHSLLLPECRVTSLADNQLGTFTNVKVGEIVTVVSFGILLNNASHKQTKETKSLTNEHLFAYGEASPVVQLDALGWILLESITEFFGAKFYIPKISDPASVDAPKFGGGLSRRSGASTRGRYVIRGRTCDMESVSEEEWKRKGAISVEFTNNGALTVVRFPKNEVRNGACDSFILLVDLVNSVTPNREIGLSKVNACTVLVENYKDEIETVPEYIPAMVGAPVPSAYVSRPMPSPRPR